MRAVCLTIKRLPSLLIAGAIVGCLPFVLTRPVVAQTPPNIKLNVNVPPQAPGNVAKEPVLSAAEIMALRDVVYFERRATILLERARQYLKDDELSLAFEALQSLLGDPQELLAPAQDWNRAPSDSFVLANGRLRSVRRETLMVFESLTRDQLNFYEKKYSETASSALQAARASGRSAAYLEVARRCFPTLAGAQATDEAATRLLDRGEAALAAKLWLRIIHSTIHRNRLNPRLFEKAATSLFLSGDKDQARTVVAEAVALFGSVRFTAKSIEVVAKNHPHFATPVMDSPASDPFGNPTNNGESCGSVPYLAPVWTKPLYGNRPFDKLAIWEQQRSYDELAETGASVFPIITQQQLIVRDLYGIRSCDPKNGRLNWRFNATLSVPEFVSELRQATPGRSVSLIETAWAENSAQGIVTTDGKRVFAIDWLKFEQVAIPGGGSSIRASNRLVCLNIPARADDHDDAAEIVKPSWSVGGSADTGPLADQLFLGAPRPVDDSLFVISESRRDRELNLVKLEAATGRVVWIQKIGLVQQPSFETSQRSRDLPMALPTIANGLVICQPDAEIIVTVDAAQGELKWIYSYGRDGLPGRSRRSSLTSRGGFRGFPSAPIIHRHSVFCLPQHSEDIHRLDLHTGQRVWKVKRDKDAYLAAITDQTVASVQNDGMRGLSLTDGSLLWTARTGLPSGRGVRIENQYVLPLKSGGIASVDLGTGQWTTSSIVPELSNQRYLSSRRTDDGRLIGLREYNLSLFGLDDQRVPNEVRPGNLLFHDGLVFSVGPQHLTAFSEAQSLLDELLKKKDSKQPVDELRVAQLEVAANREDAAVDRLAKMIASPDGNSLKLDSQSVDRAKWLLRELINRRLNEPRSSLTATQRRHMIEQLAEFSKQPKEQAYALVQQAQWQTENGSSVAAVGLIRQAIDSGLDSFIPMRGSPDCLVAADVYARDVVQQSLQTSTFPARSQLQDLIERDLQVALSLDTIDSLSSFLNVYAATAETGRVRNRLADRLIQSGQVQQAELLILQNASHSDLNVRAVAKALLISLWSQLKLSSEAGNALYQFEKEFRTADLRAVIEDRLQTVYAVLKPLDRESNREGAPDSLTGAAFVSLFSGDESALQVFEDLHPLDWKVRSVRVRQQTLGASNPLTSDLWSSYSRRVIYGQQSEFDIVRNSSSLQSEWRILDRLAGTERGSIRMPGRVTMPGAAGYRTVGHLMPVGTGAGMRSVSLLEYHDARPYWELSFPPLESGQELIEPGPATPSVCIFQTRKHLFGIDPATGRVLWRRSDLDLASGIRVDREAGLFGDEQVLVMFHADQSSYTVFSTQTGEVIRKGQMSVDFRYRHHVFGRKLFHQTRETGSSRKRVRIWDPLTNKMELDEELFDRFNSARSSQNELALVTSNSRLRVISVDSAKTLVDMKLSPADIEYISSMRLFSDERNIYVNIQRSDIASHTSKIYSLASDSVVPVNHVHRGFLIAISRQTGKLIWKTPVQQRSFVRTDRCSLPFLVGLSRVSPKRSSSMRSLEVRVIDRMTGENFVESAAMIKDRIVHYQIDRDAGELQLHGINSRIDIQFRRLRNQIPLQEQSL